MKRIVALILIFTFALSLTAFFPVLTASAEEETYLLIERDNVALYEDTRKAPVLFVIPRSYYVKVLELNYDENYHKVEYNGIVGLVKASEVSAKTENNVQDPYYTAQSISAHISTHLYKRPSFLEAEDSGIIAYGATLTYLGKISGEKGTYGTSTWFAVSYSGHDKPFYIHAAMTENLDLLETALPLHPNSAASTAVTTDAGTDSDAAESADSSKGVDVVRILLIIGIFVPIVIILVVLFRPPKRRARSRDDREADRDDY